MSRWTDAYRDAARRGEQEPVEFADYPVPTGVRLPRQSGSRSTTSTLLSTDSRAHSSPPYLETPAR